MLLLIIRGLAQQDLKHNWAFVYKVWFFILRLWFSLPKPLFLAQLCLKSYIVGVSFTLHTQSAFYICRNNTC